MMSNACMSILNGRICYHFMVQDLIEESLDFHVIPDTNMAKRTLSRVQIGFIVLAIQDYVLQEYTCSLDVSNFVRESDWNCYHRPKGGMKEQSAMVKWEVVVARNSWSVETEEWMLTGF